MSVASEQLQLDHISKQSPVNIKHIINYLNLKFKQTKCNIIKVFFLMKYKMLNKYYFLYQNIFFGQIYILLFT